MDVRDRTRGLGDRVVGWGLGQIHVVFSGRAGALEILGSSFPNPTGRVAACRAASWASLLKELKLK